MKRVKQPTQLLLPLMLVLRQRWYRRSARAKSSAALRLEASLGPAYTGVSVEPWSLQPAAWWVPRRTTAFATAAPPRCRPPLSRLERVRPFFVFAATTATPSAIQATSQPVNHQLRRAVCSHWRHCHQRGLQKGAQREDRGMPPCSLLLLLLLEQLCSNRQS